MRVVLVDPSRTATKFIARLLQARHHDVVTFADGREALAHIKSDIQVGALITSAEPLSISGLELCWETRLITTAERPIYVILMSSTIDHNTLIKALDSGADDFIGKPPVPEELYARLRAAERVVGMQRELVRLANTDPLTGMPNRRAFFDKGKTYCSRAGGGSGLGGIMLDIDHFKQINDRFGHDVGDDVLCAVAQELSIHGAIVGRLGGEEFALLLEGCNIDQTREVAERLRVKVAGLVVESRGRSVGVTCSLGVSEWHSGDTLERLLKRADIALYEAKHLGRNRVVAAGLTIAARDQPERKSA